MKIKVKVQSVALDCDYGGEQIIEAEPGERILDEIFVLNFFRIIIDAAEGSTVCFRLMEGSLPHWFVLESYGEEAVFERETSIGTDNFTFTLLP